jgi:hypothetical protein
MTLANNVLAISRVEVDKSAAEEQARIKAHDRLFAMLGILDSKTSALLRFNAIVVAALAIAVVFRGADLGGVDKVPKYVIQALAYSSLAMSLLSCGIAFPVIYLRWGVFDEGKQPSSDGVMVSKAELKELAAVVESRTKGYRRSWQCSAASGFAFALAVFARIVIQ